MKKLILLATVGWLLGGCYTPLNNSGVSTNKPWLDVSGTRLDYKAEQYDSCVQFRIRFWPQEAAERIALDKACISTCCWRSEQNEIVLDFNKNFEQELAQKGRARRYFPEKVTLKVTHSNFVNLTKVSVSPRNAITNKGLLQLTYQEVEDPLRLAQLAKQKTQEKKSSAIVTVPLKTLAQDSSQSATPVRRTTAAKKTTALSADTAQPTVSAVKKSPSDADKAKQLLQSSKGTQIDTYFYQMNKIYRKQGAVFMLSERLLQASTYGKGIFLISCHAKARTGVDETQLKASDFSCGKWLVNIYDNVVAPYDTKARNISQL